ncbi:MAG: shikimate kinase [Rhodoferax sp.]|nr:shikimate kinase [Rhodoferax sp.]
MVLSLVGMPGGGKSTVGRHLARRLDTAFVDTDAVIEHHIGCPIRTFFEQEGEERFRDVEADVLADAVADRAGVIATGGGIVLRDENRERLREHTTCVYLRSTPEELFRRLRHDSKRPLLQVADPLARLRELFGKRDPLYRQAAHFVVETGRPSISTLVNMILMQLELAGLVDPLLVPPLPDASSPASLSGDPGARTLLR